MEFLMFRFKDCGSLSCHECFSRLHHSQCHNLRNAQCLHESRRPKVRRHNKATKRQSIIKAPHAGARAGCNLERRANFNETFR